MNYGNEQKKIRDVRPILNSNTKIATMGFVKSIQRWIVKKTNNFKLEKKITKILKSLI